METVIISCDVASGTGRDHSTVVLINSKTKAVIGEFKNNTIDTTAFSYVVYTIAKHIAKNCMIVIERNNVGVVIITNLLQTDVKSKLYFEESKKDYQEKIKDGRLNRPGSDIHNYGVWTDDIKKAQMHEILVKYVNLYYRRLATKGMADEINALIYNKNRVIDHPPDGHDDLVMGYLIGMWVYWFGKNISKYGIFAVPDIDPSTGLSEEDAIAQMMEEQEQRLDNLRDSYDRLNRKVNDNAVKHPEYKTMNDLYDEIDDSMNREYDGGNNKNINDLIGGRQSGLQRDNIFNRSNSQSNDFGNNLLNSYIGDDL